MLTAWSINHLGVSPSTFRNEVVFNLVQRTVSPLATVPQIKCQRSSLALLAHKIPLEMVWRVHFGSIHPNLNPETQQVWESAARSSLATRTATPSTVPSTQIHWSVTHRPHMTMLSACPKVLPAARGWKGNGKSIFHTSSMIHKVLSEPTTEV